MTVLSWQEHLTEKETPPRWMWVLTEELERHFEWVKRERNVGSAGDEDEIVGPVVQNEYARGRGREAR